MPKKGKRGQKLSVHNISKGFCSCGASKSSKFRLAPLKYEAFYKFFNDKRNEKKKRICSKCYLKFSKSRNALIICNEQSLSSMDDVDPSSTGQVSIVVKPSPIGGNGQCNVAYSTVLYKEMRTI